MVDIVLDGVAVRSKQIALSGIELRVRDGEVFAIVGSDPRDTSLMLDLVVGRAKPDAGQVLVGGTPIDELPLDRLPKIVAANELMLQRGQTVRAALLEAAGAPRGPGVEEDLAHRFKLAGVLRRRVDALAEVDRTRLAVALAVLRRDELIVLDDPAKGMPSAEELELLRDLGEILSDPAVTALYVTNDGSRAMRIGERIAVMGGAQLQQVGTPTHIVEDPVSLDVARLLAGDRLLTERGELARDYIELPAGQLPRPDYVPFDLDETEPRGVVYATWQASGAVKLRKTGAVAPAVWSGFPDLVFDERTGERMDRSARLDPLLAGSDLAPRPTAVRSLNLVIARGAEGVVAPSEPLDSDGNFRLQLWIGSHDEQSIVANSAEHGFPDALLPKSSVGHVLKVMAHSGDVKISTPVRDLHLPAHGASRRIAFGLRTPPSPGKGTVRVAVWYRRHLLQSVLVELRWGSDQFPSHGARIDYTVSDLDDVARFPERDLSLLVNETAPNTHRIIVNDRRDRPFGVRMYETTMGQMLASARAGLIEAHRDPDSGNSLYDRKNRKPRDEFIRDLTNLAHKGASLLTLAFPVARDRNAIVSQLRDASAERNGHALIQVAQARGARLDFPWHLVYDIGLETFAHKSEKPCKILDLWQPHADPTNIPMRCPFESDHTLNTICPFGFWGFAHILELPPSTLDPSKKLPVCVRSGIPSAPIAIAVSPQLDRGLMRKHLERLPAAPPHVVYDSVSAVKAAVAEPEREVIYFYCHGTHLTLAALEALSLVLELGEGEYIATGDIDAWASKEGGWPSEHWEATKPLIFINGCHTVDVTPMQPTDFASSFVGAGAAGVIGTEIMLEQRVASEAAEEILRSMLTEGRSAGAALQAMRRVLLGKGNVMGLAYTAYCSADLSLRC